MHTSLESYRQKKSGLACVIFVLGLAAAAPGAAGMGAGGGGSGAGGGAGAAGGGAAGGGAGTSGGAGAGGGGAMHHSNQTDLTTCVPGVVWDVKQQKCLVRHSGALPDSKLTE